MKGERKRRKNREGRMKGVIGEGKGKEKRELKVTEGYNEKEMKSHMNISLTTCFSLSRAFELSTEYQNTLHMILSCTTVLKGST